jgi:hypothetical protein
MIAATLLAIYLVFFNAGHDQLGNLMEQYVKDQIKVVIVDEGRANWRCRVFPLSMTTSVT